MTKRIMVTTYDEQLWKDFEEFVVDTYGSKYAFYGKELEKAVIYHLTTMGFKDYPDKVVFPGEYGKTPEKDIERTHKLRGHVKTLFEWIIKQPELSRIEYDFICNFLRKKCGLVDNRTYKKYVNILVDLCVLKDIGKKPFMVYQIMEKESYYSLYIEMGVNVE